MVQKYKMQKNGKALNPLVSLGIIALVLVGGFLGGKALGWWGSTAPAPVVPSTAFTFVVYDASNGDVLDVDNGSLLLYREDISEFTAAEIEDYEALFANFELDKTIDLDESYIPEAGYIYKVIFNSTEYMNQSISEDLTIADVGQHIIVTAQVADSYADLCYSDALDTTILNTTSTASVWNFQVAFLNGDGNMDADMGLIPQCDFVNDANNFFVLELKFNTTIVRSEVACNSPSGSVESISGNNITYTFEDLRIFGSENFIIEIDEDKIGATYTIEAATLYFGDEIIAVFA